MLTKMAVCALLRIDKGKPAFKVELSRLRSGAQRKMVEAARRRAISDLFQRRLVRRGKRGPEITETGRAVLAEYRRLAAAGPYRGIEISYSAAAERWGGDRKLIGKRVSRIREFYRDAV